MHTWCMTVNGFRIKLVLIHIHICLDIALDKCLGAERLGSLSDVHGCIDHICLVFCRAKPNKSIGPKFDVISMIKPFYACFLH